MKVNDHKTVFALVTNDLLQDQRMHRICSALQSHGYKVTLVGRSSKRSMDDLHFGFQTKRVNFCFHKGIPFYVEIVLRYFFLLIQHRPDIVWSVDTDTIIPAILYKKIHKSKVIYDAHEYFHEVPELTHKPIKKWMWKMVGKIFVPDADAFVTVGAALATILSKDYNRNFLVLMNVPELKNKAISNTKTIKYMLYQGVLNEGRGLDILIDAMSEIYDLELWIAGEGDLSESLRQSAKLSQQSHRIKFLGWLLPKELDEVTANAYLGINILASDSLSYRYSLANKFFDYMHAGVPSVNMQYPEYVEILNTWPVGITITQCDVQTVCTAINNIQKDAKTYNAMKKMTEVAKNNFQWEKEQNNLFEIMEIAEG